MGRVWPKESGLKELGGVVAIGAGARTKCKEVKCVLNSHHI